MRCDLSRSIESQELVCSCALDDEASGCLTISDSKFHRRRAAAKESYVESQLQPMMQMSNRL